MESLTVKEQQRLEKVYFDPKDAAGLGSVSALAKKTGLSRKKTQKWLTYQDTYTLHKQPKKKFKRRPVLVSGIDDQWQIDLVDVSRIASSNKGYKFILTCIDVLSKYAWVKPMKNKTADSLTRAMSDIFTESNRIPNKIQGDKGSEFLNKKFKTLLKENQIIFFSTENDDIKASIVERFNRTLKTKMWRYFTKTKKHCYIDKLQDFLISYNSAIHRTIKMRPIDVDRTHEVDLLALMYKPLHSSVKRSTKKKSKYTDLNVDDTVRIASTRAVFKKGYTAQWSEEIFVVREILSTQPITFRIHDSNNEEIKGSFYREELQRVGVEKDKLYDIETVLKTRKRKGKTEHYVKWKGYPDSFNSWVNKDDLATP